MAHIDLVRHAEVTQEPGPTGLTAWPDILTRLEHAPCITVGSVRGRARDVGSEFLLALDIRFASREKAIFGQPEIGFGFFPGDGGLERLPLVTGRSRAMEIITGGEDFDADTAERYGWINRSVPDAELDAFTDRFATRDASFDRLAAATAKEILNNRSQIASGTDQESTNARFREALAGQRSPPASSGSCKKAASKRRPLAEPRRASPRPVRAARREPDYSGSPLNAVAAGSSPGRAKWQKRLHPSQPVPPGLRSHRIDEIRRC